ncbi:hypothetical protein GY45DRAFT_1332508 [Cubamyces sp. BRFM 1775]|nr:hypothetical protein GY45DRAFT_1332508 [Cubamyces sp. BRFM 1775]
MSSKTCQNCHATKSVSAFTTRVRNAGGKAGEPTSVRAECTDKLNTARRKRRTAAEQDQVTFQRRMTSDERQAT